jgi:hypothetical protein
MKHAVKHIHFVVNDEAPTKCRACVQRSAA